jgi:hypothetical protein
MEGENLAAALARIDAALARIDRVASRPLLTDSDLAQRHEQLRAAATQTLQQLDALIAEQGA